MIYIDDNIFNMVIFTLDNWRINQKINVNLARQLNRIKLNGIKLHSITSIAHPPNLNNSNQEGIARSILFLRAVNIRVADRYYNNSRDYYKLPIGWNYETVTPWQLMKALDLIAENINDGLYSLFRSQAIAIIDQYRSIVFEQIKHDTIEYQTAIFE